MKRTRLALRNETLRVFSVHAFDLARGGDAPRPTNDAMCPTFRATWCDTCTWDPPCPGI